MCRSPLRTGMSWQQRPQAHSSWPTQPHGAGRRQGQTGSMAEGCSSPPRRQEPQSPGPRRCRHQSILGTRPSQASLFPMVIPASQQAQETCKHAELCLPLRRLSIPLHKGSIRHHNKAHVRAGKQALSPGRTPPPSSPSCCPSPHSAPRSQTKPGTEEPVPPAPWWP